MHRLILLPGTGVRAGQTYGGVGRNIDAQTDLPPRYRVRPSQTYGGVGMDIDSQTYHPPRTQEQKQVQTDPPHGSDV
jgi:hypothetical protein